MSDCPPDHVAYGCQQMADNAVTLHGIAYPFCEGIRAFPCGDHFHIGHPKRESGRMCRAYNGEAHRIRAEEFKAERKLAQELSRKREKGHA